MNGVPDDECTALSGTPRCAECMAPLAHDQRYCVECGARRGGLPQAIAERIRTMLAHGDLEALGAGEEEPAGVACASAMSSRSMPSPRAAAVSIMGMLAFGVVVGSVASSNAESQETPLVLAVSPPAATPTTPTVISATPAPASPVPAASPAPAASSSPPGGGSSSSTASSSGNGNGNGNGSSGGSSSSTPSTLPPVKHMFVIMLSDQGYDQTFGAPSSDPYLAKTLRKEGELLPNYYAVAQGELANEIALVSGQGPTPQTAADCPSFTDLEPAVAGSEGQDIGSGCVYPAKTLTLADQLTSAGKTWKSYVEGIGNGPHGQATTCRHPALGSADPGQPASLYDPYVTWRNPFVYFASLANAACGKGDVGLGQLATDLKAAKTTPNFSYIVPSPCDDGSEEPCVPGAQSGLAAADRFLRGVVPEIEASPAYRDGGMIAITFDQASQSGPDADSSSCCDNPTQYPNLPATTTTPTTTTPTTTTPAATTPAATTPASELTGQTTPTGGGGEVGLLLISQYVKPGSVDSLDYFNHYSLLSSIEKLFGLKGLGYATDPALPSFGKPQYNDYAPS